MMKKTAAVMVTYNRKELLQKSIEALCAQTCRNVLDILIIDNASTDGTKESIEKYVEEKEIQYFNTGANLGGAGGFCFGIKLAAEMGYDTIWIMDDDTLPSPSALEELLKKDQEYGDKYGFLSSKVLWKDGSICTMNIQKETKWKRLNEFGNDKSIQYASFVSLFIRTDTVKQLGLPYKDFFIWADDWEYTRRISKRKPCFYVSSSVVTHWCGSNVGADIVSAPIDRINRFNYMYRNDVVLYMQDGLEGLFYLTIRNIIHIIKVVLKAEDKKEKLNIIRKGTKEGKKFYPKIEYPEDKNT